MWHGQKEAKLVKQFSDDGYGYVCSSNGHCVGVRLGGGVMDRGGLGTVAPQFISEKKKMQTQNSFSP